MNNKGQMSIGNIFLIFIGIVVGIAIIVAIFNAQGSMTTNQSITGEYHNISSSFNYINNSWDEVFTYWVGLTNAFDVSESGSSNISIINGQLNQI